jgi:hypothetical protein
MIKKLSEIIKTESKNIKNANYCVLVDLDNFLIFYAVIPDKFVIVAIVKQLENRIELKQYEVKTIENDTLAKLNAMVYSHSGAYIPSKRKAEYILRLVQRAITKNRTPTRFKTNNIINQFIKNKI